MAEEKCSGHCSSCSHKAEEDAADCRLKRNLGKIRNKIVVMSGKGGVGKSTVAVNLALALAMKGNKVGLLDVDVHGPSIPKMLHVEEAGIGNEDDLMVPVETENGNLKIISIGLMTANPDDAIVWRGPVKMGVIKQLLSDVAWGELDYLVIDCPPGTGDEPLSVCQMIPDAYALVVTTPQQVSASDVSKSLNFCNQLGLKMLGIVENMSGFVCPKCGEVTQIFSSGAGDELAKKYHVAMLGRLPIDPAVCAGGDAGEPFVKRYADTPAGEVFRTIVELVEKTVAL